jgi:hypothetical protein
VTVSVATASTSSVARSVAVTVAVGAESVAPVPDPSESADTHPVKSARKATPPRQPRQPVPTIWPGVRRVRGRWAPGWGGGFVIA